MKKWFTESVCLGGFFVCLLKVFKVYSWLLHYFPSLLFVLGILKIFVLLTHLTDLTIIHIISLFAHELLLHNQELNNQNMHLG